MATLQTVLQAPVLLSLATCYPEGFSSEKRKGNIPELAKCLENAVTEAGLHLHWEDFENFKNQVQWTRKKLVEAGFLTGCNNDSWKITDCGVTQLRQIVKRVLGELPAKRLDAFWQQDGPDGFKRWVVVFDRVPEEMIYRILFHGIPKTEIYDTVRCGRGEDTARLWSAMFDTLPNGETIDLLTWMYEDLLRLFLEFHRLTKP